MANFVVTNTNDSGPGSLRQAIVSANSAAGADTITFDGTLAGETITLASSLNMTSEMSINGDIDGDGRADITVSGNDAVRVFSVGANATATLRALNITDGRASSGAGISIGGGSTLNLIDSTVSRNTATGIGGGISVEGTLNAVNSTISDNAAGGAGGGIGNVLGLSINLVNTTLSGNTAGTTGGAISAHFTAVRLDSSTVFDNDAGTAGGGVELINGAVLTARNSVIAGNSAPANSDINETGVATINATNSFFGTAVTIDGGGGGNLNGGGDPLLGALTDNGGPVLTHRPLTGSPLINAGSAPALPDDIFDLDGDAVTAEDLPRDATGFARNVGTSPHIGAVEVRLVTTVSDSAENGSGASLEADIADGGGLSLREALFWSGNGGNVAFDTALAGQTITLANGPLAIAEKLTINGDTNGDRKADITISGNNASQIFDVFAFGSVIESLTLTNGRNTDPGSGGGAIFVRFEASLDLLDSTVTNSSSVAEGGAIKTFGPLTIVNSTISGSSGNLGGAIMVTSLGEAAIVNSTISGNSTTNHGGAIFFEGNTTIIGTTISGNQANFNGGGIAGQTAALTMHSSTVTGNTAGVQAGGVAIVSGDLVATNTVIAGNTAPLRADIAESSSTITATATMFGNTVTIDGGGGGNIVGGDPLLGALANNGGPVQTRTPLNGSLLIGAGNAAFLPLDTHDIDRDGNTTELLPLDATGQARVFGGSLDIGAVEFAPPVIGSGGGGAAAVATVSENTAAVTTVFATDPANQLINYSIAGGADAARFVINTSSGALSFGVAPDFEVPTDAGGNNVYDVIVRATDASGLFDDQALAVTVTDAVDGAGGGGGVAGGSDIHTLPSGGTVSGAAAELFGDTVSGLGTTGTIRFTDSVTKLSDLIISGNEVRLASAGTNSAPLTLDGDFSDGRFFLVRNPAGGFDLFFQKNLADGALVEGRALSEAEVNGAPHPAALTGDGARKFVVTLSDKATAAQNNGLGVYEIDASGNIVDVRVLFGNVKAAGAGTATIDGVEAGHKLGFFIVAEGADPSASSGAVSFVDISGGSPDLADGANLRLQIGGRTVDADIFHAYDRSLNEDGLVHARSGADPSGHGVRVAFEDLASGGDRDFQDVVFRVDMIDGNGDFLV